MADTSQTSLYCIDFTSRAIDTSRTSLYNVDFTSKVDRSRMHRVNASVDAGRSNSTNLNEVQCRATNESFNNAFNASMDLSASTANEPMGNNVIFNLSKLVADACQQIGVHKNEADFSEDQAGNDMTQD